MRVEHRILPHRRPPHLAPGERDRPVLFHVRLERVPRSIQHVSRWSKHARQLDRLLARERLRREALAPHHEGSNLAHVARTPRPRWAVLAVRPRDEHRQLATLDPLLLLRHALREPPHVSLDLRQFVRPQRRNLAVDGVAIPHAAHLARVKDAWNHELCLGPPSPEQGAHAGLPVAADRGHVGVTPRLEVECPQDRTIGAPPALL